MVEDKGVKIIRNDRGLDFRKIEQFIKMFQQKCQKKSGDIDKQKKDTEKKRIAEAFGHFEIVAEIEAIKAIEVQIVALKEQQKVYESKVRDFTQGEKDRYNSYDSIRENSPIQNFINEGLNAYQKMKDNVWAVNQMFANELWYARDLEQAIDIIHKFESELNDISM